MISRELSRTIHSGLEWSAPVEGVGVLEESFSIVFLFFRRLFRILILPLMETGAIESLTLLIGMSAAVVVVVVVVVVLVLVVMVVVGTDLAIEVVGVVEESFSIDAGLVWIGLDGIGFD
jgi:hypothetical protein